LTQRRQLLREIRQARPDSSQPVRQDLSQPLLRDLLQPLLLDLLQPLLRDLLRLAHREPPQRERPRPEMFAAQRELAQAK
jgi:hypothetical protein